MSNNENGRGDGITRRDFIHDVSLAGAALAVGPAALHAGGALADAPALGAERYYPPTRTGLRGSHPGAFETAHELARAGQSFPAGRQLDEEYDLVVVGAGISGLATAYFYRQQHGPDTRILLLDNHDDFGGHAKRNEFHEGGAMQLAWGGTVNIEHWKYSEAGNQLLRELGIDVERLLADFDYNWGSSGTGLSISTWFDEATYGRDVLVRGFSRRDFSAEALRQAAPQMPISQEARAALLRFVGAEEDALAGMSTEERWAWARSTSYSEFLRTTAGLSEDVIEMFASSTMGYWGPRAEHLSVAECLSTGLPGNHVLRLPLGKDSADGRPVSAMFPDGNASVARLLVRALIPDAFPGMPADRDPFEIVTADLQYEQLDRAGSPVRLRLNSTVLHAQNRQEGGVSVSYARDDAIYAVTAKQCVLACYNRIIPHICPSLPEAQKAGLAQCIKRPMGTVNVVIRSGAAIEKSGVASADLPGSVLQQVSLVTGINVGPWRADWNPDAPTTLHFFFGVAPENPAGLGIIEQSQAGRLRLLAMDFEDFEQEVKRVLAGIWGPFGLDVDNDILAITVNRWPHGYARDVLDLEEPAWKAKPGPYEIGRQRFGNIAIANSDSGADAYTHTAIDQAWRAVGDLGGA